MKGTWVETKCLCCDKKVHGYRPSHEKTMVFEGSAMKDIVAVAVKNLQTERIRYVHNREACKAMVIQKKFLEFA